MNIKPATKEKHRAKKMDSFYEMEDPRYRNSALAVWWIFWAAIIWLLIECGIEIWKILF